MLICGGKLFKPEKNKFKLCTRPGRISSGFIGLKNFKVENVYIWRLLVHLRSSPHGVIPLGLKKPGKSGRNCRPWTSSWPVVKF